MYCVIVMAGKPEALPQIHNSDPIDPGEAFGFRGQHYNPCKAAVYGTFRTIQNQNPPILVFAVEKLISQVDFVCTNSSDFVCIVGLECASTQIAFDQALTGKFASPQSCITYLAVQIGAAA